MDDMLEQGPARVPHARGDEPSNVPSAASYVTVFPTHVGMNRQSIDTSLSSYRVPHARGDEPTVMWAEEKGQIVFPTHVGMNRACRGRGARCHRVPHARGDEPQTERSLLEAF